MRKNWSSCISTFGGFLVSGSNFGKEFVIFEIDKIGVDESVVSVLVA